jgi:prepilin-type N-terminal cleavage/methylation domain-containing protein
MFYFLKTKKGFSFIEMMTTVAVLSVGIVAIYQSFFKSLEYINHMTYRLHALNILSNKIEMIQKEFEVTGEIHLAAPRQASVIVHGRRVEFQEKVDLVSLSKMQNIYQIHVVLSWRESGRNISLSRSCYIYHDNSKPS